MVSRNDDFALRRVDETGEEPEDGAFAAPRAAVNDDEFAASDFKTEVVDDGMTVVDDAHAVQLQEGCFGFGHETSQKVVTVITRPTFFQSSASC